MYKDNKVRTLIQEACESLMDTSGRKDVFVEINSSDELAGKYLNEGINVLDKAGNCKISDGDLFISINGRKSKSNASPMLFGDLSLVSWNMWHQRLFDGG